MKVILIILSYFFILETNAYKLKRIEGIDGYGRPVHSDREGNTYIAFARFFNPGNKSKLYKLNPSNEITRTVELPDYVEYVTGLHITRQNDVYLIFNGGNANSTLEVILANATEAKQFDQLSDGNFEVDRDDNLFYCKYGAGVHVIRPNSSESVAITNLENKCFVGDSSGSKSVFVLDQSGNIYFQVATAKNKNVSIAQITKQALQEEIPQATFISAFDNSNQQAEHMVVDDQNNLWITISDRNGSSEKGIIKKFTNGKLETVLIDQDFSVAKLMSAKDKIFVVAKNFNIFSIYYITLNNEKVEIQELKNLTTSDSMVGKVVDSEGNAYFSTDSYYQFGPLILIKPNETIPTVYEFPLNVGFERLMLDFNEDLWFSSKRALYYLQKGKTSWESVKKNPDNPCTLLDFNINFIAKKVYVSCLDGTYIVESG